MALLDHTLMEFEQATDNSFVSNGIGDLERFFQFWYQRRALLEALTRSRLSGMLVERATQHALHERMMPGSLLYRDPRTQQMALIHRPFFVRFVQRKGTFFVGSVSQVRRFWHFRRAGVLKYNDSIRFYIQRSFALWLNLSNWSAAA